MNIIEIINQKISKTKEIIADYEKFSHSDEILENIKYWNKVKSKLKEWKSRITNKTNPNQTF